MTSLSDRVRDYLAQTSLIPDGSRVLVGYSGGPDSTALLVTLHELGFDVVAAHLHHGQRESADRELGLCQSFCAELDVPFAAGRADVPRMARELKIGIEEAGRKARYEFFDQAAFRFQCSRIATAHTRTDHAETVLLNLVRGAGLSGLGGIPESRGNIVRPLLSITRQDTLAFCADRGLWTVDDPANTDIQFSRSRIRQQVMPHLAAINPDVEGSIHRLSRLAREEDAFLDSAAAAALEQAEVQLNGSLAFLTRDAEVALRRQTVEGWPRVLVRRGVRLAAMALGAEPEFSQIEAIVDWIAERRDGSVTFNGGRIVVELTEETVHFRDLTPMPSFRHPLTFPGETYDDEGGWVLTAVPAGRPDEIPPALALECLADADSLQANLHFRSVQAGDRMVPIGMTGTKKISDLLQEAGLTLAARQRLPILCDMVGPFWIPGVRLADRVRLTDQTTRVVRISLRPSGGPEGVQ